ncbi:MAG TPA: HNH endonuclease [Candidatus Binataceae bacterium]|jgi:5-methylcytosine-specific restriction endonuclease McrA
MAASADSLMAHPVGAPLLNSKVLVLNRSYLPVHVTSVKRAFALLYQGVARAVDEQYRIFDFDSWRELAIENHHERVGVIGGFIRVPRVLLLTAYERVPKRHVRFSRFNIYARDNNTCQYCGKRLPRTELNLDHVVPRSRGGMSTWENVVCSCHSCNRRKGGRTPDEAGMPLVKRPLRPQWTPFSTEMFSLRRYREWMPFLTTVDTAYWNTELLQD